MKRSHLFVLVAGLIGFGLAFWLNQRDWFEGLERQAHDAHLRDATASWAGSGSDNPGVVMVAVDRESAAWLTGDDAPDALVGVRQWPFSVATIDRIVQRLASLGVTRIGFACDYPAGSGRAHESAESELRNHISVYGLHVVFAGTRADTPFSVARPGLLHDPDGVVRRAALRQRAPDGPADSFALSLVCQRDAGSGRPVADDLNGLNDRGWLDRAGEIRGDASPRIFWAGPAGTLARVSLRELLADGTAADDDRLRLRVAGRIVIIGPTWGGWSSGPAWGSADAWGVRTPWYTPAEQEVVADPHSADPDTLMAARMPAAEVHANVVAMLLRPRSEVSFSVTDDDTNVQILAAACLILVLAVALLPPLFSLIVLALVIAGLFAGTAWVLQSQRVIYSTMGPIMGACIVYGFGLMASWLAERREKRYIQALFGKYVSKEVARQLARSREAPKLGGERREITVLFSDIAGFTSWSERLGPEKLLELLNEYLGAMAEVVFEQYGTLDKFMGDAVMAFWNAPVARRDHALRACECALQMETRLQALNRSWTATGLNPLGMRLGINTGEVVVGNAGSGERFDYTAFGDDVNLASRLEGTAKFYGVAIVISAATLEAAGTDRFAARQLDRVKVVGRTKPVDIYELMATRRDLDANPDLKRFLDTFQAGVAAYFNRNWPDSSRHFMTAQRMRPDDGPTRVFLARIARFSRQAPPDNWDGSVELPTK